VAAGRGRVGGLVVAVIVLAVSRAQIAQEKAQKDRALAAAAVHYEVAVEQRRVAAVNYRKARDAVDQMLTRAGEDLAPYPHTEKVRQTLLAEALRFYEGFLQENAADPELRQETGHAYTRIGDIYQLLGRHAEAGRALRQAIVLFQQLADDFREAATYRHEPRRKA